MLTIPGASLSTSYPPVLLFWLPQFDNRCCDLFRVHRYKTTEFPSHPYLQSSGGLPSTSILDQSFGSLMIFGVLSLTHIHRESERMQNPDRELCLGAGTDSEVQPDNWHCPPPVSTHLKALKGMQAFCPASEGLFPWMALMISKTKHQAFH